MSWLRNLKAKQRKYPEFLENEERKENFYQFALNPSSVINDFGDHGFQLIEIKPLGENIGLKQELGSSNPLWQRICEGRFSSYGVSILSSFFAYHTALYVFKKDR